MMSCGLKRGRVKQQSAVELVRSDDPLPALCAPMEEPRSDHTACPTASLALSRIWFRQSRIKS